MKETKIFTFNNVEKANEFLVFLRENEITFEATDCSYDYLNQKFVFKCEMDETEERVARTLIEYNKFNKLDVASTYSDKERFYNGCKNCVRENNADLITCTYCRATSRSLYERRTEVNNLPLMYDSEHHPDDLPIIKFHSNKNDFRHICIPEIKELVFNDPATIIFWEDGTKTVVKAQNGEAFDKEKGFCMAIVKKLFGNEGNYYNIVDKWINKKAKIYDDSSKMKSNKTYDHKNEITKKRIRKDV